MHFLINGKYTEFDDSKFIGLANDNNSELFNGKVLTEQLRNKIMEYIQKIFAWCKQWECPFEKMRIQQNILTYIMKKMETRLFCLFKNHTNVYIYMTSNLLLSLQFFNFMITKQNTAETGNSKFIIK